MPFDLSNKKVSVFSGINDVPVAPTSTSPGNGSHIINQYNGLVDAVEVILNSISPASHTHWHIDSIVTSGTPLVHDQNTNQRFNAYSSATSSALNDAFKFDAVLQSGTYTLSVLGFANGTAGILDCKIDGVLAFNNMDWYGNSWNITQTRQVTIPSPGNHQFLFTVIGKNSASGGYYMPLTRFRLQKN